VLPPPPRPTPFPYTTLFRSGLKSRDQGLKVPYVNDGPPAGPAGPTRRPSPMPSPTSAGWRSALDRPSGYGACAGPTSHEHLGAHRPRTSRRGAPPPLRLAHLPLGDGELPARRVEEAASPPPCPVVEQ